MSKRGSVSPVRSWAGDEGGLYEGGGVVKVVSCGQCISIIWKSGPVDLLRLDKGCVREKRVWVFGLSNWKKLAAVYWEGEDIIMASSFLRGLPACKASFVYCLTLGQVFKLPSLYFAYSRASVRALIIIIVEDRESHDQAGISSHLTSTTLSRSPPSKRQLRHHLSSREKPQGDSFFWGGGWGDIREMSPSRET